MQTESLKASLLALLPETATAADPESQLLLRVFAEVTAVLNQRLHQCGSSLLLDLDRDIVINCLHSVPHTQLPMVSQACSLLADCGMQDEIWAAIYTRTFGGDCLVLTLSGNSSLSAHSTARALCSVPTLLCSDSALILTVPTHCARFLCAYSHTTQTLLSLCLVALCLHSHRAYSHCTALTLHAGTAAGCNPFLPGARSIQCAAYRAFVEWNQFSARNTVVLLTPHKPHHVNTAARGSQKVKPKNGVLVRSCSEGPVLDFGGKIEVGYSVPYSTELGLGTEDFTVEGWYRIDQQLRNKTDTDGDCECLMMMSFGWQAPNMQGFDLYTCAAWHASHMNDDNRDNEEFYNVDVDGKTYLNSNHPSCVYKSPSEKFWEVCDGQFHHFAHCRSEGMLRLYQDGELVAAAPFTESVDPEENLFVGSTHNDGHYHPSDVVEFRVIRGQARYRGNFTPIPPFRVPL